MIIPSFKPAVSYKELNTMLARMLFADILGQKTDIFERKLAEYLGVKHAILVPSARWGLYYILQSLNLKKGDEIILPAFSYFAVPAAIIRSGMKPVFVDINPNNLSIDIRQIEKNITERTRVIIPTHLCGLTCGLREILDVSRRHNITVIEDCAQSLGAEYLDKKAGSWGDASYFSFSITKHFTTLGGGIVATSRDDIADAVRHSARSASCTAKKDLFIELLKGYIVKLATSAVMFPAVYCAMRVFYFFDIDIIQRVFHEKEMLLGDPPEKGRLNNIQAELGMTQLSGLDRKNESRGKNGTQLYDMLKDIKSIKGPSLERDTKNIFSTCPVLVKDKKNIRKILLNKGIDVSAGHMRDCSRLDVFREFNKSCPNASRAEEEVIYLPLYPELTLDKKRYIEIVMKEVFKNILSVILILAFFISGLEASENIIHVPGEASSIQEAIDKASDGDTVLVMPGRYKGSVDFKGKKISVKSESGPEMTIIDGEGKGSVIIFNSGENNKTILEGFTIQNGRNKDGGGVFCYKSWPVIKKNIIENNEAENGGGVLFQDCFDKRPMLISNIIRHNNAVKGGGVRCSDSSPLIVNNIIINNNAARLGGGLYWRQSSSPYIVNNTIMHNTAGEYGGGIFGSNYIKPESEVILANSILRENTAPKGAQVALNLSGTRMIIASSAVQDGKSGIFLMKEDIELIYLPDNISEDPTTAMGAIEDQAAYGTAKRDR